MLQGEVPSKINALAIPRTFGWGRGSPGSSRPEGVQRVNNRREYADLRHPHSLYMLLSCTALGPGRPRATGAFASTDASQVTLAGIVGVNEVRSTETVKSIG